jgi:short subunit dehydrogenase-like uncharacterized protein
VPERDLDVVVFGATGVTGRRVAGYLARRAPEVGASWAAAARDPAKVERILGEVGVAAPEAVVADVEDPGSLAEMAARARVVLNLVGPYTRYGRPVIEACIAGGAHYADLTGEIPFMRRTIEEFDAEAAEAGVKIVEACGFESLPADLAVLLAAETAHERWDDELATADLVVSVKGPPGIPRPSDAISGGTFQSLLAVASDEDAPLVTDPAALVDDPVFGESVRARSPIEISPRRGPDGAVIAPMPPAAFINPAVIHRSAALRAGEEGSAAEAIRYREGVALRGPDATLPLRYLLAATMSGVQAGLGAAARARPAARRRIAGALGRILPRSGFGPDDDRLEEWSWRMSLDGRTSGERELRIEVEADGHPGYLSTARMLAEAGLLLAEPGATPERAGCLTPAIALGTGSVKRFEAAGLRFSVEA